MQEFGKKFMEAVVISAIVLAFLFIPGYLRVRWYGPMTQVILQQNGFFNVEGKPLFLFSGEMHYFRIPKHLWFDRLLKAKRAGLNAVASYVAWNWHEPSEGAKLFGDELTESFYESSAFSRDLEGYIREAETLGLYVIARPGPYICSEWDSGGHPNWLYAKATVLRSLDPAYIAYTEKWYGTVLPIITRHSITRGGSVVMVQVENEYFWGDANYLLKLYELARKHVDDLPIVTNEDWHLEGTTIINTIDDYPSPWDISGFDAKVRSYVRTQPGMPKMHMELEGGWFSTFGAPLPTSRGSFPASWTETLIKTTIGLGVNAVNIYMFHGGTNPGYYTGKYITTTYDYEAAISEWGYLRERYYAIKRVALFTRTFNDLLVSTKPSEGFVQVSAPNVEVFSRVGEEGSVLTVLRNLGDQLLTVKLKYGDEVVPYAGSIPLPTRNAKLVILNYRIPGTPFKLLYTASEPLLKLVKGNDVLLVLYGNPGEEGGFAVEADDVVDIEFSSGVNVIRKGDTKVVVTFTHGDFDSITVLKRGSYTMTVVATSKFRAGRTWLIDDFREPLVIISNIYFIGKASLTESGLELEMEMDEKSAGPALIYTLQPLTSALLNGFETSLTPIVNKLYRLEVLTPAAAGPSINAVGLFLKREDGYLVGRDVEPSTPLERIGILDNGYATYLIRFNSTAEDIVGDKTLYISYFNDFASAVLNGVPLASVYHSLEVDASKALKQGVNELVVLLESTGHPNDGQLFVPNGIVGGVYLGKIREEEPKGWLRVRYTIPYGRDFSFTQFLNDPKPLLELLKDPQLEKKGEIVETIDGGGLYVKKLNLEKKEGRYILTFTTRALLFVNKRFLGVYLGPVDITDHLTEGENELALAGEWLPRGNVKVKVYRLEVKGDWKVAAGTLGLAGGWYKEKTELKDWIPTSLPLDLMNMEASLVWLKGTFTVKPGTRVAAPLKLKVEAKGVRMLLYFNGQFIGRFVSEGPQTDFYIPEPLIREGENSVTVMVHVVSDKASITSLTIETFHVHPLASLKLSTGR
ncbi:MAG: beta-galactosidase [Thermofilaceae archaeon]|nr:beta-galactosidase [Thermofilaceae archaeon]